MTQREALKKTTEYMNPLYRAIFLADWLEDINWHGEHKLFMDRVPKLWMRRWNALHELHVCRNIMHYSTTHAKHLEESGYFSEKAQKAINEINDHDRTFFDNELISKNDLYEYAKTQDMYRAISLIFGFGMDSSITNQLGKGLVDDLWELVNAPSQAMYA